jgi:hypothetical protein
LGRGHAKREGGRVGVGARWVGVVDRHDMNTAAPGCSDSGGRPERAANRGATGVGDSRAGADRRGRRQRSLVVSSGMREGESKSEAVVAPTGGPGPHSAWRHNSSRFESKRNSTGFKLISN